MKYSLIAAAVLWGIPIITALFVVGMHRWLSGPMDPPVLRLREPEVSHD